MSHFSDQSCKPRDNEIAVFGLSHPGKVRQENQDHYLIATLHKRINVISTNLANVEQRFPLGERRLAYLADR